MRATPTSTSNMQSKGTTPAGLMCPGVVRQMAARRGGQRCQTVRVIRVTVAAHNTCSNSRRLARLHTGRVPGRGRLGEAARRQSRGGTRPGRPASPPSGNEGKQQGVERATALSACTRCPWRNDNRGGKAWEVVERSGPV